MLDAVLDVVFGKNRELRRARRRVVSEAARRIRVSEDPHRTLAELLMFSADNAFRYFLIDPPRKLASRVDPRTLRVANLETAYALMVGYFAFMLSHVYPEFSARIWNAARDGFPNCEGIVPKLEDVRCERVRTEMDADISTRLDFLALDELAATLSFERSLVLQLEFAGWWVPQFVALGKQCCERLGFDPRPLIPPEWLSRK